MGAGTLLAMWSTAKGLAIHIVQGSIQRYCIGKAIGKRLRTASSVRKTGAACVCVYRTFTQKCT